MSTGADHEWRRDYRVPAQVRRDQVAAALRDQPGPATSTQIGRSVNFVWLEWCSCEHPHSVTARHYSDGFDVDNHEGTLGVYVLPDLNALAKAGLATREKVSSSVLWTWVGEPVDLDGIEDFEPDDRPIEEA